MECTEFVNCDNGCGTSFIRKRWKLNRLDGLYAGLIVCLVPSVVGVSDWTSRLTYDKIYNDTSYVQIPQPRPYNLPNSPYAYNYTNGFRSNDVQTYLENAKDNELEYEEYDYRNLDVYNNKEQLLVGFSHDPFRYSVPEVDYRQGVRNIDPQSYEYRGENRGKRGVLHLYNMMLCATGCDPLAYKGYGCYCGFLGSGHPTDGIDRCCQMHDECYENIFCPFYTVYFQPYYWKCYRGEPLCALENYSSQQQLVNGCAARLCECDRRFAMCLRRHRCPRRRALCHSSPLRLLQNLLMFH